MWPRTKQAVDSTEQSRLNASVCRPSAPLTMKPTASDCGGAAPAGRAAAPPATAPDAGAAVATAAARRGAGVDASTGRGATRSTGATVHE
jgi:hypothetical protein